LHGRLLQPPGVSVIWPVPGQDVVSRGVERNNRADVEVIICVSGID
jgi:hypothetical protein